MIQYLGYLGFTFGIALLATPLVKKLAQKYKVYAMPNHRTMHQGKIPKLGGGSILIAFIIGVLGILFLQPALASAYRYQILSMALGAVVLFVLGAFDDKMDLDCTLKLSVEILVAFLAIRMGWRVETLLLPAGVEINLGVFSYPLSVLWIVGIINAFNMIDGLDGLAGGIAIVVALVSLAVAGLYSNSLVTLLAVLLLGATAGFLRYNINPATIFMGDSGSLSLGFIIACISLQAATLNTGRAVIFVPLLLLGLPITDTSLAIVRRVRKGIHPFHADREHIHHRLVNLGLTPAGAAMVMVGISLVFGIMAFLVAHGTWTDLRIFGQLAGTH